MNQNDARLSLTWTCCGHSGSYDVHLLQYSGAIWWPWTLRVARGPPSAALARQKRANGLDRALRYVTAVRARHVVPFAGSGCETLDEDLFALNDLTGDPANTFPDQMVFLDYLREHGIEGGPAADPRRGADGRSPPRPGPLARQRTAGDGAIHRQGALPSLLRKPGRRTASRPPDAGPPGAPT